MTRQLWIFTTSFFWQIRHLSVGCVIIIFMRREPGTWQKINVKCKKFWTTPTLGAIVLVVLLPHPLNIEIYTCTNQIRFICMLVPHPHLYMDPGILILNRVIQDIICYSYSTRPGIYGSERTWVRGHRTRAVYFAINPWQPCYNYYISRLIGLKSHAP